jgi:hypothetical protein
MAALRPQCEPNPRSALGPFDPSNRHVRASLGAHRRSPWRRHWRFRERIPIGRCSPASSPGCVPAAYLGEPDRPGRSGRLPALSVHWGGRGTRSEVDEQSSRPFGASRQAPGQLVYQGARFGASVCRDFLAGSPRMVGGARPLRRLQERGRQRACVSRSFVSPCGADHCPAPRLGLIVSTASPAQPRRSAISLGRISARSPPLTRWAVLGW